MINTKLFEVKDFEISLHSTLGLRCANDPSS